MVKYIPHESSKLTIEKLEAMPIILKSHSPKIPNQGDYMIIDNKVYIVDRVIYVKDDDCNDIYIMLDDPYRLY